MQSHLTLGEANPLWQKSLRARLRLKHIISWGVVTLTLTAFVSLIIYTTMTEQEMAPKDVAAKAVLPGIIVIQAILLMMLGTGSVAAGVARERDEGLLDYQRMTPMSPTAKILGYLFGLPVREYALFAMTLPFVAAAVWIGNFNLLTLGHFYAVFFTSVLVYHMTALVAGMVAPKPRSATLLSLGLVVALYFVLPNLSRLGITFFEFLTIRPTFFGLVQQEMPPEFRPTAEASGIDSFRDVPFFAGVMHPTIYTLLVQGFVVVTMFMIVHRKWRDASSHLMSKLGGVTVFAGVAFFLLASVWALVVQDDAYWEVFRAFEGDSDREQRAPESLEILMIISAMILGGAYLLVIATITPSRDRTIEGWRRARKLGHTRFGVNADAASSLPAALIMIALALGSGFAILRAADAGGDYFSTGPSAQSMIVVAALCVGVALFVQGLRERFSLRVFMVTLFLLWMVPFFVMSVMYAAFEAFVPGSYVALPCPPVSIGYALAQMMHTTTPLPGADPDFLPEDLIDDMPAIVATGAAGYLAAAVAIQGFRHAHRAALRRAT